VKKTARFAALGVIAALSLTACGKNDAGSGNGSDTTSSADVCKTADGSGP
jgi:hypothetical protein